MNELFSNNLINWLLLVVILIYMWMRLTPPIFAARKEKIDAAMREAEQARLEGEQFQKEQEARIQNAEAEAAKILDEAKKVAADMAADIKKQTETESAALIKRIDEQIEAEKRMAITEMRSRAATVAVRLAEASLPGAITGSAKSRLLNQFIEQLEHSSTSKSDSNGSNGTNGAKS
ncbi:MAG: F0F1 ATP synthase subunit B [Candidatus Obscuribacterales bacterium]|jgi:F-type H+-transporting ATPase subunit b|nr:F0F1 ATP synthase subunit B [Candidatus Obscuribacterales bacterium]